MEPWVVEQNRHRKCVPHTRKPPGRDFWRSRPSKQNFKFAAIKYSVTPDSRLRCASQASYANICEAIASDRGGRSIRANRMCHRPDEGFLLSYRTYLCYWPVKSFSCEKFQWQKKKYTAAAKRRFLAINQFPTDFAEICTKDGNPPTQEAQKISER